MSKNVLIIGGAGFIGSNLCSQLVKNDYEVYSFDMASPAVPFSKVHYIEGDFFDDYTLEHVIEGMDYIIHALSTVNPGNSNSKYMQGYERDLVQTVKLCKMVQERGIRMIFLSSGGTVYGDVKTTHPITEDTFPKPINHYGNVKLCIENVIRTFNYQTHTKILIARISNPYGPGQDFNKGVGFIDAVLKKAIMQETLEVWGDGEIVRDYIYIDDVCQMLISLFEYDGDEDTFNISSGVGTSQNQIIAYAKEMGLELKVAHKEGRSVDAKKIVLDNSRVMQIHEVPVRPLKEGMKQYYNWLISHREK